MKELILVRHAKSSWEFDVSDLKRPLKARGYKDIGLVAKAFLSHEIRPEIIFSSPAKRAVQTAKLFIEAATFEDITLEIQGELYDFSGRDVIDFVKSLPDRYKKVMIFGHNHAFTSISNIFGSDHIDNVPTSGLVHLKFPIENWKDLKKGVTALTIFPRDYK